MQKFENVDILKSLKAVMQTHTEHFQSDFQIDVKILKQAAKSPNPEDKKYLWICRPAGTWCLRERDTFIKDTREHNTFCFYAEQTRDKILAYGSLWRTPTKQSLTGKHSTRRSGYRNGTPAQHRARNSFIFFPAC